METSTSPELTTFAEDVLRGLSSTPKRLSSKYFYDDEGSRLFQEIMKLPEYYPTRAEYKLFTEQTAEIAAAFTNGTEKIDLIELGAGDGTKTAVLIEHFLKRIWISLIRRSTFPKKRAKHCRKNSTRSFPTCRSTLITAITSKFLIR